MSGSGFADSIWEISNCDAGSLKSEAALLSPQDIVHFLLTMLLCPLALDGGNSHDINFMVARL